MMASDKPVRVAIVRDRDLESRELALFDWMDASGLTRSRAIGDTPSTPYGTSGLRVPISRATSVKSLVGRLPLGTTVGKLAEQKLGRSLGRSLRLGRHIGDAEVVNTRETTAVQSLQAVELTRGSQARVVVSVAENIPFAFEESSIVAGIKQATRARADWFIANSPEAMSALEVEGVPMSRIDCVPLAVDTERFAPGDADQGIRSRWGVEEDRLVLLYAGRMIREKGLVNLLLAHREIVADRPEVVLVFVGSGPDRDRIQRVVRDLEVQRNVSFAEWVPSVAMPDVYRSADLVVLPSLSTPYWLEQFGYNLAEAMACGVPIAATRSGSIPSTVGDTALLFDDYSIESIVDALSSLLSDASARSELGRAARSRACSHFGFDVVGPQLRAAFDRALSLPQRG